MIAGGTGLAPCYQVLAATTKVRFLYAKRIPDDILMRDVLENLAAKHPDRFMLNFTVDQVTPQNERNVKLAQEWKGHVGSVTKEMANMSLFEAADDGICLMCGPPVMLEKACYPALHSLGHRDDKRTAMD